jgi:flagellar hook-associated protein FlgK
MAGLIGTGLSGILSHQAALNTTGNNITNANTPGYSRQEAVFETQDARRTGAGSIGWRTSIWCSRCGKTVPCSESRTPLTPN